MNLSEFGALAIRDAFPQSAQSELEVVLELLPPSAYQADPGIAGSLTERGRWALIEGKKVQAFYRIYNSPLVRRPNALTDVQVQLLGCLYTRHHDGFVREGHLDDLLSVATPWTPMFVLQLLGEYIVEISARSETVSGNSIPARSAPSLS